jgi:phospholipase C
MRFAVCAITVLFALELASCVGLRGNSAQVTVNVSGPGKGTIISSPSGIQCPGTCSAMFDPGTMVTLTEKPSGKSAFSGWSGACSGMGQTCTLTLSGGENVTAGFHQADITAINHIIIMAQENRSFDSYFGALRQYWAQNGYPEESFDGLPQFNNPPGAPPTNPGCDPAFAFPGSDCVIDPASPAIASYHFQTMCVENPSPSWNESHVDFNLHSPTSGKATLDGMVWTAAHDARNQTPPFNDVNGRRAMGYYTGADLNYYYFMASNFATSDRWFSPAMSRTQINRMYLLAATSHGHAYTLDTSHSSQLNVPIIFQLLQQHGITWKIYVRPGPDGCTSPSCLFRLSYINQFTYGNTILAQFPQNLVPDSQFLTDAKNGKLPQVALIETASEVGLDEHPAVSDTGGPPHVQAGAQYVSSLINGLMGSQSWSDSAFILTFDEFGGFYDHVAPQPAVSPDGIPPSDLLPGDVCTQTTGPTCDFTYTGYRVPLIVISPFSKKHYVSHTVADYTAMLKFIETRFKVPSLTKRDAAQVDMTEFFDFAQEPWAMPPQPPAQAMGGACYLDRLP